LSELKSAAQLWIRIRAHFGTLDPDPHQCDADPQHCFTVNFFEKLIEKSIELPLVPDPHPQQIKIVIRNCIK
jgi:hypothetical protein